ncbi:MAG: NAD-dependent epimerase/dehydratase family protein [Actinomycetes bacterium]
MRIFVAGATGVLGRRLVPLLVEGGHQVTAMTRTPGKAAGLRATGAEPVVADALDRDAVLRAVVAARPEVVVHQLTALAGAISFRRFDRAFALTNRLRTEGTDHLLEAARAAGTRRFVAQSFAGWPFARVGGPVKTEGDPLDPDPPAELRRTLDAIRHLESAVLGTEGIEGVVLRYGGFYGPGTSAGAGGSMLEDLRRRRFPVVGAGTGVWSFIHIDDAAAATVAAIEGGTPGIYNVVDDDPAPTSEWLPALASQLGAPEPRRLPGWLVRLAGGPQTYSLMTRQRGASNAKAVRDLGWRPSHSWKEGFAG